MHDGTWLALGVCLSASHSGKHQRQGPRLNAYIFDTDTELSLYKGFRWLHYASSPYENPNKRAQLCIVQWLQRVHACLQRRWCLHGGIQHVSAFSLESLFCLVFCPSHPLFLPLILDMNSEPVVESKQPTHQCTQWLLIKSQTVLSYIAPMGLGNRKERARLDRCCFLAARLRGWG